MLDFLTEKEEWLTRLGKERRPIVLYGTGNGADKLLDLCWERGIPIAGIFASDDFVCGQEFRGFAVQNYGQVIKILGGDIVILLAFSTERQDMLSRFACLAERHMVLAPNLPIFGGRETVSIPWVEKYEAKLKKVYDKLADGASRKVFAAVLNYKLSGKLDYLSGCESRRADDLKEIFTFTGDEAYLDLGAYDGDTVAEFLALTGGRYGKIIAVEPDRHSCAKLKRRFRSLLRLEIHEMGIWDGKAEMGFSGTGGRAASFFGKRKYGAAVDSIDGLLEGGDATYIKMDVEGAEGKAISGGTETIRRCRPKILAAAYHYDTDIFELPLLLWDLVPEYRIYLRKHPYVPAWEVNIFACI
ncbi:MAG: FkbM family methyltransferase [Phascolarctobacterium sp.]|nr:FkbM family methyltransferase [Phascolarctobacterium sp.]